MTPKATHYRTTRLEGQLIAREASDDQARRAFKDEAERLEIDYAEALRRLRLAHDYIQGEWRNNSLRGPMGNALIDSLNQPIE